MIMRTIKTNVFLVLFLVLGLHLRVPAQDAPKVGDSAPDISLPYATKDSIARSPVSLAEFLGKRVVILAFYPADWSTGCTKEVCTMRDNIADLQAFDAEVLGISGDYVWSHHEWAKSLNLPFKLLSDHAHVVARQYASYNEKSMYNRRTVFVINKLGKIAYSNLEFKVGDLADFERLKSALEGVH